MSNMPPFLAGQEAYRDGLPCTPPDDLAPDDCYPGPAQMWVDGWNVAKGMADNREQMARKRRALALMSDGRERTKAEIFAKAGELQRKHFRAMCKAAGVKARRINVSANESVWTYQMEATQ